MTTRKLPLLPLRGIMVFPYMIIHLDVGREKSINALEQVMMQDRLIMLATQKDAQNDKPQPGDIYEAGTVAEIKQLLKLPGGTIRVLVEGLQRAVLLEVSEEEPCMMADVRPSVDTSLKDSPEMKALVRTTQEYDAAAICARLGGGGHRQAAGCEIFGELKNAKAAVLAEVEKSL